MCYRLVCKMCQTSDSLVQYQTDPRSRRALSVMLRDFPAFPTLSRDFSDVLPIASVFASISITNRTNRTAKTCEKPLGKFESASARNPSIRSRFSSILHNFSAIIDPVFVLFRLSDVGSVKIWPTNLSTCPSRAITYQIAVTVIVRFALNINRDVISGRLSFRSRFSRKTDASD